MRNGLHASFIIDGFQYVDAQDIQDNYGDYNFPSEVKKFEEQIDFIKQIALP